ncbi:MAG: response regulator transcription factor [Rhodospirillaceae bacterium]
MKVFVVEDSRAVCERLVELIEAEGEHRVVGKAATYDAAVTGIAATEPDVGIFDIRLERGNGIDALAEAKRRMPRLVGIVMSNYITPQHKKASVEAGAQYFLDKSADFERITEILSSLAVDTCKEIK